MYSVTLYMFSIVAHHMSFEHNARHVTLSRFPQTFSSGVRHQWGMYGFVLCLFTFSSSFSLQVYLNPVSTAPAFWGQNHPNHRNYALKFFAVVINIINQVS